MAKKPKKSAETEKKELISKLIDEFDSKSVKDIEDMFKDMFSPMLQEMLEGELDDHLGYEKYEHSGEGVSNSRNGHSSVGVLSKKFDKRFHVFVINFQRICQKVVLFSYVFGCLNVFISPKIPV